MAKVPQKFLPFLFAGAALILVPAAAFADSPRHFLEDALRGDNSEIMLGRLAADRARDPAVRDFGRTLARDHSQAREEVISVGRRFGLSRNRDVTDDAREMRDHLRDARGREFDRMFIQHMVDDHRHDIDAFRDESREHHGEVSDLAARQLPTLQQHLDMAVALDRSSDRGADQGRDGRDQDRHDRDGQNMDGQDRDGHDRDQRDR